MLIRASEIPGRGVLDVRLGDGRILEIARALRAAPGEATLDAAGGALLPGLHDHHIHLLALAAARASIPCGPPDTRDPPALAQTLLRAARSTPTGEWLRGVGYHESVAGPLDRDALDGWVADRPLRIQHRSGALWMLNSAGLSALGVDRVRPDDPEGLESDARGRPTGRFFRADDWLRARLERRAPSPAPLLSQVGLELASYGVTGVTDATPDATGARVRALEGALAGGELRQRIRVMAALDPCPRERRARGLEWGPLKQLLDERSLPSLEDLAARIARSHLEGRPVALHCVTRSEIVLALGALEAARAVDSAAAASQALRGSPDRIEHAAIAPPEIAQWIARLGVSVVTQPHFVSERGDEYRADVDPRDREWLYRVRGLLEAGIAVGAGSDAPFGHPDPWRSMRAAVERRTASGVRLGAGEAVSPERALALFTSPADDPGGPPRAIAAGSAADLCLLDCSWQVARRALSSAHVRSTFRAGEPIWSREGCDQRGP
ncbi:MAG: amidohydrolase family protein [Myxococcota bacterium]